MQLTWHIIRKDLLRLRVPLAIWALLQLLTSAFPAAMWFWPELVGGFQSAINATVVLYLAVFLCTYDFAVRLIQEDSVADSHAFWLTRPIGPIRLLTAKCLGLLLFALLAALPAFTLQFLFTRSGLATQLYLWLYPQALAVFPALVLASLTRSSRACLFASLLMVLFFSFLVSFTLRSIEGNRPPELTEIRLILPCIVMSATGFTVIALQFFLRRPCHGWIALAAGFLLAATIPQWWHIPLPPPAVLPRESESPLTRPIEAHILKTTLTPAPKHPTPAVIMRTELALAGVPSGHFARPGRVVHHWSDIPDTYFDQGGFRAAFPSPKEVIENKLPAAYRPRFSGSLNRTTAERLSRPSPAREYTGDFTFQLHRSRVILEVPLQDGAHASNEGHELRVVGVTQYGVLKVISLAPPASPDAPTFSRAPSSFPRSGTFAIHNRRTGEIISLDALSFSPGVLGMTLHEINFTPASSPDNDLRDLFLVKIIHTPVATFTRTLHELR